MSFILVKGYLRFIGIDPDMINDRKQKFRRFFIISLLIRCICTQVDIDV